MIDRRQIHRSLELELTRDFREGMAKILELDVKILLKSRGFEDLN